MIQFDGLTAAPYVLWRWTAATPDAPAQARATLKCALDQLGLVGEAAVDAVLVASEFVANATEHAVGPYEMRLRRVYTEIVCEVEDHDPRIPAIPDLSAVMPFVSSDEGCGGGLDALCGLLAERGRGLRIIHELTNGIWGFRSSKGMKIAWFAVPGVAVTG